MRIGGFRLEWIKRRWWLLALSVIGVTMIAVLASRPGPATYSAEAVMVVRSGATTNTPGSANEANRLAVTYAQLIPLDIDVLDEVARALNVNRSTVEGRVSVTNDANTAILRVQFEAPTRRMAIDGATAVANALIGPALASDNFNGLALSRLPTTAERSEGSFGTVPAGIVLGTLLGLVLILAWERSRGRVEDSDDLERLLDCPVTSLEGLSPSGITALLQRWHSMSNGKRNAVAFISATEGYRSLTTEVATVFAGAADEIGGVNVTPSSVVLVSGGAPGSWEVGERVLQQADMAVLVVPEGTSIASLRQTIKVMESFGSAPAWGLYAAERIANRAKRRHGNGDPVVLEVGAKGKPIATT